MFHLLNVLFQVFSVAHSAAKLKRMWKEVSSNFARAEAGSKVSGQGGNDFWDFCGGRADVYYLYRWCDHRQGGRKFCSASVYPEDEDDSTKEGQVQSEKLNRKRQKGSQALAAADILNRVDELLESEISDAKQAQEDTWIEQKLLLREQRAAQKLTTLYAMLDCNSAMIKQLLDERRT
ncbi:hypothetical protein PHMEG_00034923 [Phytophthora megakarya]|uniref:Uncharacterized protein n=1 Tax=Phytophthora megakarya TaxID=4795 RepID=A0A225USL7_9STRA|nr:hypothetical protein PHMEG_00034923 [Phytophthora megakarya]